MLARCRKEHEPELAKDPASQPAWVSLLQYHHAVALREAGRGAEARPLFDQVARQWSDRPEGWELVRLIYPHTGNAAVVGFTGPPGVGKSTLIGAVTKARREAAIARIMAARERFPADALPAMGADEMNTEIDAHRPERRRAT